MIRTSSRAVLVVAVLLLAWGVAVLVTGGVVIETPWRTISSRAAIRPFIAAGLVLLLYATRWRDRWREDLGPLRRVPAAPIVVGAAVLVTLVVGLMCGTRIAGGPDASGYVSEAALFVRGELTQLTPEWARNAPWNDSALTASPVGYRPAERTDILVPVYSPGLPLMMALFQVVAGPGAVFYVIPLLGAVTVWATWRLGRAVNSPWAGAAAAALVATSAGFLMMLVQPMSDVAAAALWTLAVLSAWHRRPFASGLATAIAVLVRPNIVPLAAIPALLLLDRGRRAITPLVTFALTVCPAAATIGALNWYYHGSPLRSGYGTLDYLYGPGNIGPNLQRYGSWFVASQTVLPLLGLIAPAFVGEPQRRRVALVTTIFPVAVLALYLPYAVFPAHEWPYLRFLLPAYPALMIGFAIAVDGARRWIRNPALARAIAVLVVAAVAAHSWDFARANSVFAFGRHDQRYARAVSFARQLPRKSVLVSLSHSGTLALYTRHDVLRFEAIGRNAIDTAVDYVSRRGYPVYLIGDPFEVDMFRERFAGTQVVGRLDRARPVDLQGSVAYALIPAN